MDDDTKTTPAGIGTALRKIETTEGAAAALKQANRWLSTLEELFTIACPTTDGTRPGGPQKFCVGVLMNSIYRYLATNSVFIEQQKAIAEAVPSVEPTTGELPAPSKPKHKKPKAEKPNPDDLGKGC